MVAANDKETPTAVLTFFATSARSSRRLAVARNPNTPGRVLAKLCEDRDLTVRMEALENTATPDEAVARRGARKKLCQLEAGVIRERLAQRLDLS